MEDWLQMLIIIIVVIGGMVAYLVYLGGQIAGLQGSISDYNNMKQAIDGTQTPGFGGSSQVSSPFGIIMNGLGG